MDSNVTAYFESVPAERKEKVERLHTLVTDLFPDVSVDMRYKMPTYSHGDGWVAIANQKNYVSLYTCNADHLVLFKATCPEIKTGKGCINFRDRDQLPELAVKEVIKLAMERPKASLSS